MKGRFAMYLLLLIMLLSSSLIKLIYSQVRKNKQLYLLYLFIFPCDDFQFSGIAKWLQTAGRLKVEITWETLFPAGTTADSLHLKTLTCYKRGLNLLKKVSCWWRCRYSVNVLHLLPNFLQWNNQHQQNI